MSQLKPVVSGIAGLGGYAGTIIKLLLDCQDDPQYGVKLVACCSSNPSKHPERVAELNEKGVEVDDYAKILQRVDVEAVWLPLPIDLHLPFTEQALKAGKAVMCEKPAAGCVDDCDAMIRLRDEHKLPVIIGYQDVYDPLTVKIKRLLLDGKLGRVKRASLWATWPRDSKYYGRAGWAGAFRKDGVWVMDSPANNALAHFINITLFFLGSEMNHSVEPTKVDAELYRVNPIENFDTISARFTLPGDVPFTVNLTHACEQTHHPCIDIEGEDGSIHWTFMDGVTIRTRDGEEETARSDRPHTYMCRKFNCEVRGVEENDIALSTLESARAPLVAVNGASEATPVYSLPADAYVIHPRDEGHTLRAIKDIETNFQRCAAEGKTLHELGVYPWTTPGGAKDLVGYNHFAGPATA